jgi:hypothetical protein
MEARRIQRKGNGKTGKGKYGKWMKARIEKGKRKRDELVKKVIRGGLVARFHFGDVGRDVHIALS